MITSYLDGITVGDRHVSPGRTITETDLVSFAMFSGDWHPIHTDAEYAAADPVFGGRIAHGALVLSVALGLVTFWPPANKIAAIGDPAERAAFVAGRQAEQEGDFTLLRMGGELIVDAVVQPELLRAELTRRLRAADGWERPVPQRHHVVSPV